MTLRRKSREERGLTRSRDPKDDPVRPKRHGRSDRPAGQGIENDERGQLQPGDKERAQKNR